MVFKGGIFGGVCWNSPNPYLNSATMLLDIPDISQKYSGVYITMFVGV